MEVLADKVGSAVPCDYVDKIRIRPVFGFEAARYDYAWKLYTKVNHTGASGLLIRMAESFYDQSSMALEVSVIPEYYRDRCESLRGEIARCKADKTKLGVTGSKKKKRVRKAA